MYKLIAILLIFTGSASCTTTNKPKQAEPTIAFNLIIDPRLREAKGEYRAVITKSILNIQNYAEENDWSEFSSHPIIKTAEVVFDRKNLERRVIEIFNVPPDTPMLPGLTAANNSKDLVLFMPEQESKKYSPKFIEDGFYEKLITHELAHILHILVLQGDEDRMGPIWFYEGFPVTVARQLESFDWKPSKKEVLAIMEEPKRGDYRQYGWMVRQLIKKHPIKTLVVKAGEKNFNEWALSQIF